MRQAARPDALVGFVRVHVPDDHYKAGLRAGDILTAGFAYPVRSPWNTVTVLDLLVPGSLALSQELTAVVACLAKNHNAVLRTDYPTWATTILSRDRDIDVAAALAFPHMVKFHDSRSGQQELHVRIDVRILHTIDPAQEKMEECQKAYAGQCGRTPLYWTLMENDVRARRVDLGKDYQPAIGLGHRLPSVRIDHAQQAYDRTRRRAADDKLERPRYMRTPSPVPSEC